MVPLFGNVAGNICRSPLAEAVMNKVVSDAGAASEVGIAMTMSHRTIKSVTAWLNWKSKQLRFNHCCIILRSVISDVMGLSNHVLGRILFRANPRTF